MNKILLMIAAMHTRILDITEKDRGATATEYAMLIAFIVVVIATAVALFGTDLYNVFKQLGSDISNLFTKPTG